MSITYNYSDKVVVVTGGARGIGAAIVEGFASAGAKVITWDLEKVDVSDPQSCKQGAAKIDVPVDVIINNAGITRDQTFRKMSQENFDAVIDVNLRGVFNVTKSLFDKLSSPGGRIINIASIVGIYGNFGQTNYAAAKAGVIGMTKTWSREFAGIGVTVNAVAPGFIHTEMVEQMPEDVVAGFKAKIPAKRLGAPEEVAGLCLFLASNQASYITGAVINIDGGLTL